MSRRKNCGTCEHWQLTSLADDNSIGLCRVPEPKKFAFAPHGKIWIHTKREFLCNQYKREGLTR